MTSGELAEQQAREYLQQQGLIFVTANVRYKFGEIDLIMKQQQTLVFVEVKYRQSQAFGGAINALSAKQIHRIRQENSKDDSSSKLAEHCHEFYLA